MCEEFEVAAVVDATGLTCPLPLLKAKQGLKSLAAGQALKVIATDPGSVRDFNSFAELSGNRLLSSRAEAQQYIYIIEKA
ncbi:sulfurtransferase TusA family protein [Exilibacterium tricleocarpae]|uniref:Sulfurtransferase TusA family protein n=1 Tax=Exilibacterium tricleocarpae TaxID=2591008 RepID=A0A545U9Y9_9GAMM|nr:sulfurtransferase TusA family protein [Exilibacterium tricleocarpae]TQV86297.1 sulfurtransferase TusA family protein [Exilibacterium tricleocarpae]